MRQSVVRISTSPEILLGLSNMVFFPPLVGKGKGEVDHATATARSNSR